MKGALFMLTTLQLNGDTIQQHIQNAQQVSPYQQGVQLIAVTKTVDSTIMRQLFANGLRCFGENRTQTLLEKQTQLADITAHIEWHFIGRLQTRQVKDLVGRVDYIHSLDRLSLAQEIQKRFDSPVKCFVQVNVSGELTKTGIAPEEVANFLQEVAQYDRIRVVGLMTMAPFDAIESDIRAYFRQLKQLQQSLMVQGVLDKASDLLSMGMSQDYTIAVEEGATHVRVGTALYEGITV